MKYQLDHIDLKNFMNSDFNEKADMWTMGTIEFLTGEYLFEIDSDCSQNERDEDIYMRCSKF